MTDTKLKKLVADAIALDRQVRALEDSLDAAKALLVAEARGREDEHVAGDGDGTRWSAEDDDGNIARVSFPAPTLKGTIKGEGKAITKIKETAGRNFERLFRPALAYAPCEGFREEAAALLGRDAARLVKLCTTESAPRVAFETKPAP